MLSVAYIFGVTTLTVQPNVYIIRTFNRSLPFLGIFVSLSLFISLCLFIYLTVLRVFGVVVAVACCCSHMSACVANAFSVFVK